MPSLTKTDNEDYALDGRGVLVNTNKSEYELYIAKRNAMKTQSDEIQSVKEEINSVRNELSEIKTLLSLLIQGNK
jgi:hypothetical protein